MLMRELTSLVQHAYHLQTDTPNVLMHTGGTFAMYSILCRSLGITPLGGELSEADKGLSRYSFAHKQVLERDPGHSSFQDPEMKGKHGAIGNAVNRSVRKAFKQSKGLQMALLVVVVLGCAMVVGDGILTPAISVLSAVGGLNVAQGINVTQGE